jgi:hypothetical protein
MDGWTEGNLYATARENGPRAGINARDLKKPGLYGGRAMGLRRARRRYSLPDRDFRLDGILQRFSALVLPQSGLVFISPSHFSSRRVWL